MIVGKSVLREHIESFGTERDVTVASCSRTLHTYLQVLQQLAKSFKIESAINHLEKNLIQQVSIMFANVKPCIL
ncbi:MAG: hypothetical protein V4732_11395 [Pseudomonadota bacterium]